MEKNGKKALTIKNRGPFHFLRVAFYMLRRSNRKTAVQVVEKSAWRRFMCLMRPLHSPCLQPSAAAVAIKQHAEADDSFQQQAFLPPPASPDYMLARGHEDGMSSRYTSAEDLRKLEEGQNGGIEKVEEGQNSRCNEVIVGDLSYEEDWEESGDPNEIDIQAEEFIAKFYEEMRLQRVASMARYTRWLEKQAGVKQEV